MIKAYKVYYNDFGECVVVSDTYAEAERKFIEKNTHDKKANIKRIEEIGEAII